MASAPVRSPVPVARVVQEHIEREFGRVVSLAELGALTGLSPQRVSRVFRASLGVAPCVYLAIVRVRRASELLARGHPPSAVAYDVGYSDQSHFTRQFKRVAGVTPGQYARTARRVAGVGGVAAPPLTTGSAEIRQRMSDDHDSFPARP